MGIDPGQNGAVALLMPDGRTEIHDFPVYHVKEGKMNRGYYDLPRLVDLFEMILVKHAPVLAMIEDGIAMPSQSSASTKSTFLSIGALWGILAALKVTMYRTKPSAWKKYLGLSEKRAKGEAKATSKEKKEDAIALAKKLYPKADITKKKHDGRAEALLIAHFLKKVI